MSTTCPSLDQATANLLPHTRLPRDEGSAPAQRLVPLCGRAPAARWSGPESRRAASVRPSCPAPARTVTVPGPRIRAVFARPA